MNRPPSFEDLFDDSTPEAARSRLREAHDLLVEAGPPAELPPWLEHPPTPWLEADRRNDPVTLMSRRRARGRGYAMAAAAAAIALVAFLFGYSFHPRKAQTAQFAASVTRTMHGTAAAPNAAAAISIGKEDAAGNWPMLVRVGGLKPLPRGGYYELFLTRGGKPSATCGTFRVASATKLTSVRLNAPYDLRHFNGWVVMEHLPGQRERVLLTT